jgi:hypothetical protein
MPRPTASYFDFKPGQMRMTQHHTCLQNKWSHSLMPTKLPRLFQILY